LHRTKKESENLRKRQEKGKQVAQYSRRPVTRETTKSTSKSESVFKGTYVVSDDKDDPFAEPDQILNVHRPLRGGNLQSSSALLQ
jgi:hypothetical protein